MEIIKAHWSTDGDHIRMSMPINKVDQERRIVSGFATLDNIDKQGDVVPVDASIKAFEAFRGNIREMHQPIAVGKVVSFKPEKYFDPETNKFYSGIYVSAYVSKGAQSTWEKVLDGTLTGFSIGGEIHDAEDVFDENLGKRYQVIKDYSLSELSLVDNPANQFANVISIEKGVDTGYLSKAVIDNVFWCRGDDIVQLSKESSASCPQCDASMTNIGFVESNDDDKASVVKSMISSIKKSEILKGIEEGTYVKYDGSYGKVMQIIFKGGATFSSENEPVMAKSDDPVVIVKHYSQNDGIMIPTNRRVIKNISSLEKVNAISKSEVKEVSKMDSEIVVVDEIEKSADAEPVAEVEAAVTEDVAKAVETDEVAKAADEDADDEEEVAKVDEATEKAEEALEAEKSDVAEDIVKSTNEEVVKAVNAINESLAATLSTLAETVKALDAKIEGINKSVTGAITEVQSKVESVQNEFGKRVDAVEKETAFRKSADLGEILQEEPVVMQKSESAWGGRFLTNADLFR